MTNYTTASGVQSFSITIASGSTTGTAVLGTAVGAGAFVNYDGINPSVTTNFAEAGAYLSWATAAGVTTITATRNTGTAGTVVIKGTITDGNTTNLVVAVQQGTVTITASTSGTASVTAPGSDGNSVIHFLGDTGTGTTLAWDTDFTRLTQSGTTVTATVPVSGTTTTGFCLTEFQASCMTANAVQRISATSSSSVTSFTATVTAVVLANAITFYGGSTIATVTTNPATGAMRGAMSATTTLTVNVNTASANAKTYNASLLELNSGVLNSAVQRNTTTVSSGTSQGTNINSVNTTYSGVSWLGNTTISTGAVLNAAEGAAVLGNGSTSIASSASLTTSNSGDVIVATCLVSSGSVSSVASPYLIDGIAQISAYNITTGTVSAEQAAFTCSTVSITYCSSSAAFTAATTIAKVQIKGVISGTSPASITMTSTGAGNLLVVAVSSTSTITGVTDNLGQTWVRDASADASNGASHSAIFYFPNTAAGVTSITVTTAGTVIATGYEFSGASTSTPLETSGAVNSGSVINHQGVTVTTNASGTITGSWEVFEFPAFIGGGVVTIGFTGFGCGGIVNTTGSGTVGYASCG